MLLETEKESVCINQLIGQKKDEIEVEGDVIVNDIKPDVLNIISTNGIPCVYKKEVMDGKVRIDGSLNTYIIYLADSESSTVRSLNTVLDFTRYYRYRKLHIRYDSEPKNKNKKIRNKSVERKKDKC